MFYMTGPMCSAGSFPQVMVDKTPVYGIAKRRKKRKKKK